MLALVSCERDAIEKRPEPGPVPNPYNNVVIIFQAGYNDLSGALATNIDFNLREARLPDANSSNAILIFSHCAKYEPSHDSQDPGYIRSADYITPTEPVLIRAYSQKGSVVLDTIQNYSADFDAVIPENMTTILNDIATLFPADHYGMVYSSHGTGWLPAQNYRTRSVGASFHEKTENIIETDICQFIKAIPMHLDYMIFDACYMGSVEVAYQMRNCCDRIVASVTEMPSKGIDYTLLPQRLLGSKVPDLEQVCRDFMSNTSIGGAIALYDCSALDSLAIEVQHLIMKNRARTDSLRTYDRKRAQVQHYSNVKVYDYFYDLRDIFSKAGIEDLSALDKALKKVVVYEDHTKAFKYSSIYLDDCHGISMNLPHPSDSTVNAYYRTLDFNKATNWVE